LYPQQKAAPPGVRPQVVAPPALSDTKLTVITVIAAVPLTPAAVAVIVADPDPTPVKNPDPETVATPGLSLDQLTE